MNFSKKKTCLLSGLIVSGLTTLLVLFGSINQLSTRTEISEKSIIRTDKEMPDSDQERKKSTAKPPPSDDVTSDSYQLFSSQFSIEVKEGAIPSNAFFRSLHEPERYLRKIKALKRPYQPEKYSLRPINQPPYETTYSLEVQEGSKKTKNANHYPSLPAVLEVNLDGPPSSFHRAYLLRWIHVGSGKVMQLSWFPHNELAGGQTLTTRPAPLDHSRQYRIEVYDGGESMEFLGAANITTGLTNKVAAKAMTP